MPGICGILTPGHRENPFAITAMTQTMVHEAHYSHGTLETEAGAFGWALHGGSFSDCLPIWNESKDICLLFAGEAFVDEASMVELRARGHQFTSGTAEFLVHLYEESGEDFFENVNGLFSGALIDFKKRRLVLFNDRYGLGRIYYHQTTNGFSFASEAKALLKVRPMLRKMSPESLGELFGCGSVLQDKTLFPEIFLLPAGSRWIFDFNGLLERKLSFSRSLWENQEPLPAEDYYQELKETFRRILPRYFAGPQLPAMSLTGGLDSRIIMAWARFRPQELQCCSYIGPFRECADARIARQVAAATKQKHCNLKVDDEFLREFPKWAKRSVYLTDGTMDVSGSAGLYANQVTRRDVAPIRMTGNYGGEILRGLIAFGPAKLKNLYFSAEFLSYVRAGASKVIEERNNLNRNSFIAFRQVPWHHFPRFALESSQLTVRSPFLDNEIVKLAFRAPKDLLTNQLIAARLIADGNPDLVSFPTDRGPLGRDGVWGKFREIWQEFTFKADYAFDYGMPQWYAPINRILSPLHLESLFLGRHKFYHFRQWYSTALAQYVKDMLLDSRSLNRPYIDRNRVDKLVNAHVSGRGNYTTEIHALLTAELIHQEFID
jgi:asparagine synthase (glutamine-hydrolysing)